MCELCWLKDHARWEPESMDDTGNILMKLTGVDIPRIVHAGSVEICCKCGKITVCGIYEMTDPKLVLYSGNRPKTKYELEEVEEED